MDGPVETTSSPALSIADITSLSNNSDLLVETSGLIFSDLIRGLKCLSSDQYSKGYNDAKPSIGKHVRHILEFYLEYIRYIEDPSSGPLCLSLIHI